MIRQSDRNIAVKLYLGNTNQNTNDRGGRNSVATPMGESDNILGGGNKSGNIGV